MPAKHNTQPDHPPPVDLEFLGGYASGPEDMRHFTDVFEKQGDDIIQQLDALCIDGPSQEWVETAHKLKGSAGMLGANGLYEICARAQEMADVPATERREIYAEIKKDYAAVIAFLRKTLHMQ